MNNGIPTVPHFEDDLFLREVKQVPERLRTAEMKLALEGNKRAMALTPTFTADPLAGLMEAIKLDVSLIELSSPIYGTHASARPAPFFKGLASVLPLFQVIPDPWGGTAMTLSYPKDNLKLDLDKTTVPELLGYLVTAHASLCIDLANYERPRIVLLALRLFMQTKGTEAVQKMFDDYNSNKATKKAHRVEISALEFHRLVMRKHFHDCQPAPKWSAHRAQQHLLEKYEDAAFELKHNPQSPSAHLNVMFILFELDKYVEAAKVLRSCIALEGKEASTAKYLQLSAYPARLHLVWAVMSGGESSDGMVSKAHVKTLYNEAIAALKKSTYWKFGQLCGQMDYLINQQMSKWTKKGDLVKCVKNEPLGWEEDKIFTDLLLKHAAKVQTAAHHCDGCHGPGFTKVSKCGGCRSRQYCSTLCQKRDWKAGHKQECASLKAARDSQADKKQAEPALADQTTQQNDGSTANANGASSENKSESAGNTAETKEKKPDAKKKDPTWKRRQKKQHQDIKDAMSSVLGSLQGDMLQAYVAATESNENVDLKDFSQSDSDAGFSFLGGKHERTA